MTDSKLEISILITISVIIIAIISYLTAGYVFKNPDEIIYQTTDSLYVKQYKIYNRDSVVRAFKKPQQYVGIVSDKHKHMQFRGVPGKGGHYITRYQTTIVYNNETYITNCSAIYHEYNEGDKVIIEEVFYPNHNIKILRKYDIR
jgi:hypothetical protein